MLALKEWGSAVPEQRLRQLTVQQGPVHTPCPLNTALVFAEIAAPSAPAVEDCRLLISAAGDRLEEPHKVAALEQLAAKAVREGEFNLALEIHQRIHESPAVSWRNVLAIVEVARLARRPAAALRVINVWLGPAASRLDASQREEALDLQSELLMEGGRNAEASRMMLDELRALKPQEAIPPRLLQRALLAAQAAGEAVELLPWIERHLRTFAESKLSMEELMDGRKVSADYLHWLREGAAMADRQSHTSTACDGFFRLAAMGETRVFARLYALAMQTGRGEEMAELFSRLTQKRFTLLEIAQALVAGDAPQPARDLLATWLKTAPDNREGWRLLAQVDATLRGKGSAAVQWETFLKRFPQDVPALQQLAQLQAGAAQYAQALRTLQQIPGEHLDEATLRQIGALAIRMDDLPTAHRAQQLLVQGSSQPAVSDVLALATLTRQHADPEAQTVLAESIARLPAHTALQKMLNPPAMSGEAVHFSTAAQPR